MAIGPKHGWPWTIFVAIVIVAILSAPKTMGDNLGPAAGKLGNWTMQAVDKSAEFLSNLSNPSN
jgi:hypothetical protein